MKDKIQYLIEVDNRNSNSGIKNLLDKLPEGNLKESKITIKSRFELGVSLPYTDLGLIFEKCKSINMHRLELIDLGFYMRNESDKTLCPSLISIRELVIEHCNFADIIYYIRKAKLSRITHLELANIKSFGLSFICFVQENYTLSTLKLINISNSSKSYILPLANTSVPMKSKDNIRDSEIVTRIKVAFDPLEFYRAKSIFQTIPNLDLKEEQLINLNDQILNLYLTRNRLMHNKCKEACYTWILISKRLGLVKDITLYIVKSIWESKIDPLFWNDSLIPAPIKSGTPKN